MMLAPAGIIAIASSTQTALMMGTPVTRRSIDEWHCDEMVAFAQHPSFDLHQRYSRRLGEQSYPDAFRRFGPELANLGGGAS
jgi:hypothetical protein